STAPKTSQGKLIMVGVLGVALVAVVAVNWRSFRPRAAEASAPAADLGDGSAENSNGVPPNLATPEQMMANLAADPTTRFLRGQDNSLGQLENAPPDPFRLSPSWLRNLVRTKTVEYTPTPTVTRITPSFVFNPDSIKIQAVFKDKQRASAIINGVPMNVGGVVAGCQITKITDDNVQFQPLGQPANAAFSIPVNTRMR
ncbi:MAG: hypothetical protein WCI73_14705, partial [Phycisphaerae bacterium]